MMSIAGGVPLDSQRWVALVASDGEADLERGSRCHRLLVCAIPDAQMALLNGAEAAQLDPTAHATIASLPGEGRDYPIQGPAL